MLAWQVSIMNRISLYLEGGELAKTTHSIRQGDIPLLLPHLLECVCNIECAYFLVVLEFEELVSTVSSHVDEDVGTVVRE